MKILVTGGAGFVGSNIVAELSGSHDIVVLDDFSLGAEENIKAIRDRIEIIKGDITDYETVRRASSGCDYVLHQAAASSSPMFLKSLQRAVSVNVNGFINILESCRANDVKRLVYASTSSMYGNLGGFLKEDMSVFPPNFYSAAKLMKEYLAVNYSQQYGLETAGLRYMSIYGPNEKSKGIYANLVSQFLWSMQRNEQPVIWGRGSQTRDFTYVKDAVQANKLAMTAKLKCEIFNVGTGVATSLNELVAVLNIVMGKDIKPKYLPNTVKNYIATQCADISKIRAIGYEPRYTLEQGIREMIGNG